MSQETIFQKYLIDAGKLTRGLVSCTGAQFCGVAMIETKNRAMAIVEKLEAQLDLPKKVRMHWTGCPNSCGQVRGLHDVGLLALHVKSGCGHVKAPVSGRLLLMSHTADCINRRHAHHRQSQASSVSLA